MKLDEIIVPGNKRPLINLINALISMGGNWELGKCLREPWDAIMDFKWDELISYGGRIIDLKVYNYEKLQNGFEMELLVDQQKENAAFSYRGWIKASQWDDFFFGKLKMKKSYLRCPECDSTELVSLDWPLFPESNAKKSDVVCTKCRCSFRVELADVNCSWYYMEK